MQNRKWQKYKSRQTIKSISGMKNKLLALRKGNLRVRVDPWAMICAHLPLYVGKQRWFTTWGKRRLVSKFSEDIFRSVPKGQHLLHDKNQQEKKNTDFGINTVRNASTFLSSSMNQPTDCRLWNQLNLSWRDASLTLHCRTRNMHQWR